MGVVVFVIALPLLLPLIFLVIRTWSDKRGLTRIEGSEKAMVGNVLQGYNMAWSPELSAAVEYRKECHDEEDHLGGKKRPYFPAVSDGAVTVRPLEDTAEDLALLAVWTGAAPDLEQLRRTYLVDLPIQEVPCMVEEGGRPVGYLQISFPVPGAKQERLFRAGGFCGGGNRGLVLRLLAAYLCDMEGAVSFAAALPEDVPVEGFAAGPGSDLAATPATLPPETIPFHLRLGQAGR